MRGIDEKFEKIFKCVLPTYFCSSVFANIISFYLTGNRNEHLRWMISWGIISLLFCIAGLEFLILWKRNKKERKRIVICATPALLFFLMYMVKILFEDEDTFIIKTAILTILYCMPMVTVALYVLLEKKMIYLIASFKWLGVILLPFNMFAVLKLNQAVHKGLYIDSVGGIVYLSLAYTAVIIIAFCLADTFVNVSTKESINIKNYIINIVLCICCSLLIVSCGARGAFGVEISLILFFIIAMMWKKLYSKYLIGLLVCIPIFMAGSLFFLPQGDNGANRIKGLASDVKEDKFKSSVNSPESQEIVDQLMEGDEGFQEGVHGLEDQDKSSEDKSNEDNTNLTEEQYNITNGNSARIYLYRLAISEANKRPLSGMGVLGYQTKYMTYPHNIILEVLADFGYPIAIIFLLFLIYLVWRLFIEAKENIYMLVILVISLSEALRMMLSGNIYVESYLIWGIVLVLGIKFLNLEKEM